MRRSRVSRVQRGELHLQLLRRSLRRPWLATFSGCKMRCRIPVTSDQPGRTVMVLGLLPGEATLRSTEGRQLTRRRHRERVTAVRGRECSPTAARGALSRFCPVSCHLIAVLSTEITTLKGEKTSLQQQILGYPLKTSQSRKVML